jgi:putative Mg2+ transporter-C (MgtC) family protein
MQFDHLTGGINPHSILEIGTDVFNLVLAYLLALPIGWDREREAHRAGIRTFPIVAVASCGLAIVGSQLGGSTPDVESRILQGLITGIGFIGGGAILKDKGTVTGTATAASIWSIGIVGAAVGLHFYHVAIAMALVNLVTLRLLNPRKRGLLAPDESTKVLDSGPAA